MRNYQCTTCGEGVLLEPQEVAETGPYCIEHLFSEEFPALNQLADEASAQEQRPGHPDQETNRTATESTTHEGAEDMSESTTPDHADLDRLDHTGPGNGMKPFNELCCLDIDSVATQDACDQDLLRARLELKTEACTKVSAVTVSDIYQHGHQVHALRLEIIDEDESKAMLTLAPVQLEQLGEWLIEKAQQLYPAEAGEAR